jgi:hypothetical protein
MEAGNTQWDLLPLCSLMARRNPAASATVTSELRIVSPCPSSGGALRRRWRGLRDDKIAPAPPQSGIPWSNVASELKQASGGAVNHKSIGVAIAAISLAALLPAPATAQAVLPAYEIVTIIRSMGLDPLGYPVRHGSRYVLRAVDDDGQEVSITVDARQGRVLSVRPLTPVAAPYGPPPGYVPEPGYVPIYPAYPPEPYDIDGGFEPDAAYRPLPPPGVPRVIYAPRDSSSMARPSSSLSGAARAASARTAATPLPKPAPKRVAATPAQGSAPPELTTGSVGKTAPPAKASSAPAIPPVQGLE